jgi:hypothetical protein
VIANPDALLRGALDLHAHGSPEFTRAMPGRVLNTEWARLAVHAGMRGFVIKSHIFPTMGTCATVGALFPELLVLPSITLNPPAGGVSALSVELAIQAGARVVWMPTWSARQDAPTRRIFLERMQPYIGSMDPGFWPAHGLSAVDENGAVLPEVEKILRLCAAHGVAVASGHLPIAASRAVCRRAGELGAPFILTHPLSASVGATIEDQIAVAADGGFIEHVFIGCMPMHQRMDPRRIVEAVEAVGPQHCLMSSDAIENWNPPEPEVMRMYIATLLALGVPEDDVYLMTHDNPARVPGLGPDEKPPAASRDGLWVGMAM